MQKKEKGDRSLPKINYFCVVMRKYKQLTSEQRYGIFLLLQKRTPRKEIALSIGISESTLSRELRRNSTDLGNYLPWKAHEQAMSRRTRTVTNRKIDVVRTLRIKEMIRDYWSPEQVRGVLANEGISISIQSIYNIIHADATGELRKYLRHPDYKRRKRAEPKPTKATNIPNRTSIHDRPQEADGTRFGDFEMDLIVDSCAHSILVLIDRLTGFVFMEKLIHGKKAEPLAKVVVRMLYPFRKSIKTITTDNGSEFAAHQMITRGLRLKGKDDIIVYFADAYCSWQKGAVEYTNKLIRQFIPKGANFDNFSQQTVSNIAKRLNNRPRKKLGFDTPKNVFFKMIG